MRAPPRLPTFALVDAHVHVHPCFDDATFLDSSAANFQRGAAQVGVPEPYAGCLLLAEAGETRWFRRRREGGQGRSGDWTFEPTEEDCSITARHTSGERLFLIAGRQVATREGIEALALGRDVEIPDGLALAETLDRIRAAEALPVLPWGFGKWWLRRGSLVEETFRKRGSEELFLGDNGGRLGGRLGIAAAPRLFREARSQGVPVLPGSDPLPLAEHCARAGSYGLVLSGPLDEAHPAACVLRGIRRLKGQPRSYGRCADLTSFLRDQAALRWRRRLTAGVKTPAEAMP